MITQAECLQLPHHFTYLDVCYPGDVAWVGLSNPTDPQPVSFKTGFTSVPEPSTTALFMAVLLIGALRRCRDRYH